MKSIKIIALSLLFAISSLSVSAQRPQGGKAQGQRPQQQKAQKTLTIEEKAEKIAQRLTKTLELSKKQSMDIYEANLEFLKVEQELREKLNAAREHMNNVVDGTLSEEQKQKLQTSKKHQQRQANRQLPQGDNMGGMGPMDQEW